MTRLTLLLVNLFLLLCATTFYGQSMVQEGNQWNVLSTSQFFPNQTTRLIKIYGDTLINNETYSKLFSTRDTLGENWVLLEVLMREDTTGKVFLREGNGEEILVNDFALEVGDTFIRDLNGFVCNLQVMEVDSVTLNNGEKRKRLQLVDDIGYFRTTWIEGIGGIFGPTFSRYCSTDVNTFLLCFSEENELLYPESPDFCFEETTSVQNQLPADVQVYPNPIQDLLYIEFRETLIESYKVMDFLGKEILNGTLAGNSIDMSDVPGGTFVILLETGDGSVYSQMLVKID